MAYVAGDLKAEAQAGTVYALKIQDSFDVTGASQVLGTLSFNGPAHVRGVNWRYTEGSPALADDSNSSAIHIEYLSEPDNDTWVSFGKDFDKGAATVTNNGHYINPSSGQSLLATTGHFLSNATNDDDGTPLGVICWGVRIRYSNGSGATLAGNMDDIWLFVSTW